MIGKVASVFLVLKDDRECHCVVRFLLPSREWPLAGSFAIGDDKVIAVVGDLCAGPDPALLIETKGCRREHQRLHAVVELAVWFLAVDDVESVGHPRLTVADFEVEPLVMVIGVDISIQQEVILVLPNLQNTQVFNL